MNSSKNLVFIHGWGATANIFETVFYYLKNEFNIYYFDLPGFGNTPIEKVMTLKDYADFVYKFLEENNIKEPIIIGHSFGGAIAVKLTLLHPENISKLILVSASAIRQPRHKIMLIKKIADFIKPLLPEKLRKFILKILKLDKTDYAQIDSLKLKETFKNIINEDLSLYLPAIKMPTLVIWGEKDAVTPLKEGELIAKSIPGAKLLVIKNAGHFRFLEKPEEFIKLIKEFTL
ncbi:MAG: alpha/beta hydrolase [Patescibacteria group bacterium]